MNRRELLQSVFSGAPAAVRPQAKNRRGHHADEILFRGHIEIPREIVDRAVRPHSLYRTTHRHLTARVKHAGVTYLFREWADSTRYLGEIVRGGHGLRLHLFRALHPEHQCRWVHQIGAQEVSSCQAAPEINE